MRILVVEDEPKIRAALVSYLEHQGWQVDCTGNGNEAVNKFDFTKHDLVLLDLMLEGLPGEEVCRQIRERSNVPILMITSKSRESDTINGLELGADDYIVKPFSVKEVVARIHSIMRRVKPQQEKKENRLSFNNEHLMINMETHEVMVGGKPVILTGTEFKLLTVLSTRPGKVYSRQDLAYQVLGYRYFGDGRSVDVHVKNLRKKIEKDSSAPEYIVTVIGTGYKFTVHSHEAEPS